MSLEDWIGGPELIQFISRHKEFVCARRVFSFEMIIRSAFILVIQDIPVILSRNSDVAWWP